MLRVRQYIAPAPSLALSVEMAILGAIAPARAAYWRIRVKSRETGLWESLYFFNVASRSS